MAWTEVLVKPREHINMDRFTLQPQSVPALHPTEGRDQGYIEDTHPQVILMYVST